jgi:hypothetical protein
LFFGSLEKLLKWSSYTIRTRQRIIGLFGLLLLDYDYDYDVFVDVEGAFDNTSFGLMDVAASAHGVSSTINRWIDSMLRLRSVFVDIS